MPIIDERLTTLQQDLQDRCRDLERQTADLEDKWKKFDQRTADLEDKWKKFDLRVSTLMWLAGIATAFGLTATVLYKPLKNNVEAALVDYTKLQTQIEQVKSSIKQIPPPTGQAQPATQLEKQPPTDPVKRTPRKSVPAAPETASRALRQINAEIVALRGGVEEPYYTHGYTQDIGQLYNSVDLFISELKVQPTPRKFQQSVRFYDGIEQIYEKVLARAQEYITAANEPTPDNLTFHTSVWFQTFHRTLDEMRSHHLQNDTLSDDQLNHLQRQFELHRESVWGSRFTDWPPPLVN